jgi:predicted membrane-bound mannosyltransferase
VVDATAADIQNGLAYWFGGTTEPGCHKESVVTAYGCFLGRFLRTLALAAGPLSVFAVGGFLLERYAAVKSRPLVLFAAYWGFVSVVGYPLGTDIYGAWITVNALVPLSIPAAVGLGFVVRRGRVALAAGDRMRAGVVAVTLLLVAGQVGVTAATTVYQEPQSAENPLVQYAQPTDEFRPAFDHLESAAGAGSGGPDVVFYGDTFVAEDKDSPIPPPCTDLGKALPVQWYVARAGSDGDSGGVSTDLTATCAADSAALASLLDEGDGPALVVSTVDDAEPVRPLLEGYETRTVELRAPGRETVFFVQSAENASVVRASRPVRRERP